MNSTNARVFLWLGLVLALWLNYETWVKDYGPKPGEAPSTAVTATPGSPQPNRTGTTLRWAVLLIGKNSVSPWTIPSTR